MQRHGIELPRLGHEVEEPLELAAERHAALVGGVVQRLHAEGIARDEHVAGAAVEEGDGEDPVEAREHALALLEIEVEDHLGVGVAAEGVSLGLEFAAELAVVVDLAVEDELHRAIERLHNRYVGKAVQLTVACIRVKNLALKAR